ncbi:hypothetical protein NL676_016144 [Syzygium grande]|nr:hypothetical protein NL676_016144 [Syzygium grande]
MALWRAGLTARSRPTPWPGEGQPSGCSSRSPAFRVARAARAMARAEQPPPWRGSSRAAMAQGSGFTAAAPPQERRRPPASSSYRMLYEGALPHGEDLSDAKFGGGGRHQLAKEVYVLHLITIGVGSTIGAGVYILVGIEAYHYSYICVGEGVAWLIGWALILEYTIGGSAVARAISPKLALLFGGGTLLGCYVWELRSTLAQGVVTTANVLPFGVDGMLAGSATVFFAYIGFDSVASTAAEVKNPQRDLPLGIAAALSICCALYMMVSIVIVGLVPYFAMDPDTSISSTFASHGMHWAAYIITAGAITAL